jgi:hypothetical protein
MHHNLHCAGFSAPPRLAPVSSPMRHRFGTVPSPERRPARRTEIGPPSLHSVTTYRNSSAFRCWVGKPARAIAGVLATAGDPVAIVAVAWMLAAVTGCRDPLGRPCEADEECGSGFECYQETCVRVCTRDAECGEDETCQRYRCVVPSQRPGRPPHTAAEPGTAAAVTSRNPPRPDVVGAELRAIRRELELLRREQARLADTVKELDSRLRGNEPPGNAGLRMQRRVPVQMDQHNRD